jgi:hypothetical protein
MGNVPSFARSAKIRVTCERRLKDKGVTTLDWEKPANTVLAQPALKL